MNRNEFQRGAVGLKSMRAAEDVHELNSYARRAGLDLTQAAAG
ncbi:hypothetical protein ACFWPH_00555 [Nocardia sp. NPDC058499]